MDDPAVCRRHRVEFDRPAAGDGPLSHAPRQGSQLPRTPLAVLLDVEHDAHGAPFGSAEREVDEELERAQGLAAVADEQTCVAALDVDDGHLFAVAGAAYGGYGVDVHPVEEALHDAERGSGGAVSPRGGPGAAAHQAEKPPHGPGRASGGAVSAGDAPDADPGIFRADAEDAAAPLANDVDFDFVATDAELQSCELDCLLYCLR